MRMLRLRTARRRDTRIKSDVLNLNFGQRQPVVDQKTSEWKSMSVKKALGKYFGGLLKIKLHDEWCDKDRKQKVRTHIDVNTQKRVQTRSKKMEASSSE